LIDDFLVLIDDLLFFLVSVSSSSSSLSIFLEALTFFGVGNSSSSSLGCALAFVFLGSFLGIDFFFY